jgi:hypothetical protein
MKNRYLLAIAALLIGIVLAGCKSMQLSHLDTVEGPRQVRQGQDIDPKSITLWAFYKDGSRKVESVSSGQISFNKHSPGIQTVNVRVGIITTLVASFQTEVMALRSLNVASQPRTALFKMGDTPDPAWPGLEIRGEWDQMGSDRINLASCEITGYMKDQSGRQTIKVSYEGLTTTFDVDVRSMTSIQIAQTPAKLDYFQGDSLDLTGLRVMGVWEGFPAEELEITNNDITGFNTDNVGIQHVTVTKNARSANFDVEVMALTSILLIKPPTKTDYRVGQLLGLTGIVVQGNYTGANPNKKKEDIIPEDQLVVTGYDPNRIGRQQSVTITVRGISANFFINIE